MRYLRAATTPCVLASLVACGCPQAAGLESTQVRPAVRCVGRTATATPPPYAAPTLTAAGKEPETRGRRTGPQPLNPVCPDGQVPAARVIEPEVAKGNPLLGPEARLKVFDFEWFRRHGKEIRRTLRPLKDVYPKQREREKPLPPDPAGTCDGVSNASACYYYASAAYVRVADGGGMTMAIERPAYDGSGGPGHTLNEISVQGGTDYGNIIELGWNVSSGQYGDANPHLFVFHWQDWNPTCYDGCGWQQWSTTYFPGMDLSALVGRTDIYVGYVHWQGNWWAWFDGDWLGYFPDSEWNGAYAKNDVIQWFGEVASNNGIPPRSDMGTGQLPQITAAAPMATLCDVDAAAWVCWYRDQQVLGATVSAYYDVTRTGFGATRYGGPGE